MTSKLFKFNIEKEQQSSIPTSMKLDEQLTNDTQTTLSESTFNELRERIYKLCGIYYADNKKYLLENRISKRLINKKINSFEDYLEYINIPENRKELEFLFDAITINETYFYRAPQQFEALEKILIPEICEKKKNEPIPIFKIWSSAVSTGEEAYSIAISILDKIKPKYPNIEFRIYGSDINNSVLEFAKKGVFKQYAIRNVPEYLLNKYFKEQNGLYHISNEVKNSVKFLNLNLYDNYQMKMMHNFDIILCANVLIYFDLESKQRVVSHLYDALNNGAYLFIGYSESLHGVSKAFKLVHLPKVMVYKKD